MRHLTFAILASCLFVLAQSEARSQDKNWPGLGKAGFKTVEVAFTVSDGEVAFISGAELVHYDVKADKVVDGPLSLAGVLPALKGTGFDKSIDAALNSGNGKAYFFRGDKYLRFDTTTGELDDGYPMLIGEGWPGLKEAGFDSNIDAVGDWGTGKAYFFKGDKYLRFDIQADKTDDGYPKLIADGWPGLKEVGFDSDIRGGGKWDNGKAYFFKGKQYVRFDIKTDKIDDGYPKNILD